jgi:ribose-phosphate pyrophosphokinase
VNAARVLAWPGAEAAAARLASRLGVPQLGLESRRFPDGERYLRVHGEVQGLRVAVVAHLQPPDPEALGLRFLADALHELGARQVGLVLPYLPYMRQDARFRPGEAVTSRSFGRFLSQCADWLVTVDPHLHRHPTLQAVYDIPALAVSSAPAIAAWVRQHVQAPLLVGPDGESLQWVREVARRVDAPWRVFGKQRLGDREVVLAPPPLDGLAHCTPVLLDDIVSSGHTLAEAVRALAAAGMRQPVCIAVHGPFAPGARQLLAQAGAQAVIGCNTLPGSGAQIDVMKEVAVAVQALLSPAA